MANHDPITPAQLHDHYIPASHPVPVRFYIPAKDRRRRPEMVEGLLNGVMHMRGAIHHYRVAGTDGILYLAPPQWFVPQHVDWFTPVAFAQPEPYDSGFASELAMLLQRWETARPNAPQPEGVS